MSNICLAKYFIVKVVWNDLLLYSIGLAGSALTILINHSLVKVVSWGRSNKLQKRARIVTGKQIGRAHV